MRYSSKPVGWRGESHRHYLAAKGISTKRYRAEIPFRTEGDPLMALQNERSRRENHDDEFDFRSANDELREERIKKSRKKAKKEGHTNPDGTIKYAYLLAAYDEMSPEDIEMRKRAYKFFADEGVALLRLEIVAEAAKYLGDERDYEEIMDNVSLDNDDEAINILMELANKKYPADNPYFASPKAVEEVEQALAIGASEWDV